MPDFIVDHYGSIIWAILFLGILIWEIVGVFSRNVRTITAMVWILVGYRPEERWVFSWRRFLWFIAWVILSVVLTGHFFIGIP